jgi:hypothetical protein
VLHILAVFVDGWTLEAAAYASDDSEDRALELIDALAGHSLIEIVPGDPGPRFRMLDSVREFVAAKQVKDPEPAAVERGCATFFSEFADRNLRAAGPHWADRLDADAANIGAGIRWFLANDPKPLPHLRRTVWPAW